jgi:hypothetical protein
VYFETEKKVDHLLEDMQTWKIFKHFYLEVSFLVKILVGNNSPPPDMISYVCGNIFPFLLRFFEKHMEKLSLGANIHQDAKNICNALLDAVYLLATNGNLHLLTEDPIQRIEYVGMAARLMKALKSRDILVFYFTFFETLHSDIYFVFEGLNLSR